MTQGKLALENEVSVYLLPLSESSLVLGTRLRFIVSCRGLKVMQKSAEVDQTLAEHS